MSLEPCAPLHFRDPSDAIMAYPNVDLLTPGAAEL